MLAQLNDCIGSLLHLGPNVITFRTLLHLRQLLHLGLQQGPYPLADFDRGSKSAVTLARLSLVCYLTVPTNVHPEFHIVQILWAMGFGGTLTVKLFCVNTQGHK